MVKREGDHDAPGSLQEAHIDVVMIAADRVIEEPRALAAALSKSGCSAAMVNLRNR